MFLVISPARPWHTPQIFVQWMNDTIMEHAWGRQEKVEMKLMGIWKEYEKGSKWQIWHGEEAHKVGGLGDKEKERNVQRLRGEREKGRKRKTHTSRGFPGARRLDEAVSKACSHTYRRFHLYHKTRATAWLWMSNEAVIFKNPNMASKPSRILNPEINSPRVLNLFTPSIPGNSWTWIRSMNPNLFLCFPKQSFLV